MGNTFGSADGFEGSISNRGMEIGFSSGIIHGRKDLEESALGDSIGLVGGSEMGSLGGMLDVNEYGKLGGSEMGE